MLCKRTKLNATWIWLSEGAKSCNFFTIHLLLVRSAIYRSQKNIPPRWLKYFGKYSKNGCMDRDLFFTHKIMWTVLRMVRIPRDLRRIIDPMHLTTSLILQTRNKREMSVSFVINRTVALTNFCPLNNLFHLEYLFSLFRLPLTSFVNELTILYYFYHWLTFHTDSQKQVLLPNKSLSKISQWAPTDSTENN